ncbi:bacterial type II secretion system protein F domain protein [Ruminiclostridium hungatei]|uniref:Bacterial type II secretion system protein F domain protein n=1 Tax=Ruminiclostridium hungatei TaxID=48256 RepID=A0A1V4SS52_RUMHU|nr:type II secretion system F family protein [Ruminiclostridium hungatei]OPX46275.1 bacterial type II secretion system protein F domain protein [Ruminiclostridium hungatei]
MLVINIFLIAAILCMVLYFAIVIIRNRAKYIAYIEALDSSEPFKNFLIFGLFVLDKYNYSFNTSYDRRILNYATEIYGQEYSSFYARVAYSKKIVLIMLFMVIELITSLASGYDPAYMCYVPAVSVLLWFLEDARLKNRVKKRRLGMQLEFPDFINKLTLLLNAGMTMFKSWEKIALDRTALENSESAFYMEVSATVADIKAGMNENEAYSLFAKRIRTPEISRLMSTILQNTKRGGNDLVLSLRLQAHECWEMRKNIIRRLGEEAATKLLLPMMLMFFAILIIVVTPAFLSMQGIASGF